MRTAKKPGPRPDPSSTLSQARAIAQVLGLAVSTVRQWASLPGGIAAGLRKWHLHQEAVALGGRKR